MINKLRRPRSRRLTRAASSIGQVLAPAASGVVPLVSVLLAGVEVWGAYLGAAVLVRLVAQFVNFGSRDYLLREISVSPGNLAAAWRRNVAARAVLVLAGPVIFLVAGFDLATTAVLSTWLAAIFLAQSYDALVVYRRAFSLSVVLELASTGAMVVGILLAGSGLTPAVLTTLSMAVAVGRATALAIRFGMLGGPSAFRRPDLLELRRSWGFFLLTFSGAVQSRVDLYVVAAILPPAALGTYGVLTSFVQLTQSLSAGLLAPVVPQLYRLRRSSVLVAAARLTAIGVPVTLLAIAATRIVVELLYRLEVPAAVYPAAWAAALPPFLYAPLVYLWFRIRRPGIVVAGALLGTVVGLMVALLLVPRIGIVGAMLAGAAGQVSIAALHLVGALAMLRRSGPVAKAP